MAVKDYDFSDDNKANVLARVDEGKDFEMVAAESGLTHQALVYWLSKDTDFSNEFNKRFVIASETARESIVAEGDFSDDNRKTFLEKVAEGKSLVVAAGECGLSHEALSFWISEDATLAFDISNKRIDRLKKVQVEKGLVAEVAEAVIAEEPIK